MFTHNIKVTYDDLYEHSIVQKHINIRTNINEDTGLCEIVVTHEFLEDLVDLMNRKGIQVEIVTNDD